MVYSRKVGDDVLDFEASGALYHAALVMEDNQGTIWALMTSTAIGGPKQDATLEELPLSEKTTWGEWRAKHPETLVLSVDGKEHVESNRYDNYFANDKTFREIESSDRRMDQKASIYAFKRGDQAYVLSHELAKGGWQGKAGDVPVFLYRGKDDPIYRNTKAFVLQHQGKAVNLKKHAGKWMSPELGSFDPTSGLFKESNIRLEVLQGFDTFWYIWSMYHPKTIILKKP